LPLASSLEQRSDATLTPIMQPPTEALKAYIAELKEELEDAEERLKDLEK